MPRASPDRGTIEVVAIEFSTGARWVVRDPVNVHDFIWTGLHAAGVTDLGAGFKLLAQAMTFDAMPDNAFPPVIILVTDGFPTDDWKAGLAKLDGSRWAQAAVRAAISVGPDTDLNVLKEFLGHDEYPLLEASNVEELKKYIRWATVELSKAVSSPQSTTEVGKPQLPPEPVSVPSADLDDDDIF